MKLNRKAIIFLFLIPLILFFSLKLRISNFAEVPFPGDSMDEYSNAWVGLSLISTGMPVGISGLPGYESYYSRYINVDRIFQGNANGNAFPINYPWFDHPPMMGLAVGGFSYASGARIFEDMTTQMIRKPVIIMSIASIGLSALLAYLVFGLEVSILTALILATSPLMVINSRMVQAENGFTPLLIIAMIIAWQYIKHPKFYLLVILAFVSGLAMLFKLSAITIPICSLILILSNNKSSISSRIQEALIYFTIVFSVFGLFFVYGFAIDWKTFLNIFFSNSERVYGIGMNAITELLTQTKITGNKFLGDGWPLIGWLSLPLFINQNFKFRIMKLIWLPIVVYLVIYLFFGSQSYGWYRIPFFPFLVIIGSWSILQFRKNIKFTLISLISLLIPIGMNFDRFLDQKNIPQIISVWRVAVPTLLALGIGLIFIPSNKWISRFVTLIILVLLCLAFYTNWLRVNMLTVNYWYKVN